MKLRMGKKQGSLVREYKQRRCDNYGTLGHNKKKCKNPRKPPFTMDKSKGGRPKKVSVSSSSTTLMMPIATATIAPPATQSSTPIVPTATASSVAPANNAATSFQTIATPMVSPSKEGRKKS